MSDAESSGSKNGWFKRLFFLEQDGQPPETSETPTAEIPLPAVEEPSPELLELKACVVHQSEELASARKELEEAKRRQQASEQALQEKANLANELAAERMRINSLQSELNSVKARLVDADKVAAGLRRSVDERGKDRERSNALTAELEKKTAELKRLEAENIELRKSSTREKALEKELSELKKSALQLTELKKTADAAQASEANLRREHERLTALVREREGEKARLAEEAATARKASLLASERILTLEADLTSARDEATALARDLEAVRREVGAHDPGAAERATHLAEMATWMADATSAFFEAQFGPGQPLAWRQWARAAGDIRWTAAEKSQTIRQLLPGPPGERLAAAVRSGD